MIKRYLMSYSSILFVYLLFKYYLNIEKELIKHVNMPLKI